MRRHILSRRLSVTSIPGTISAFHRPKLKLVQAIWTWHRTSSHGHTRHSRAGKNHPQNDRLPQATALRGRSTRQTGPANYRPHTHTRYQGTHSPAHPVPVVAQRLTKLVATRRDATRCKGLSGSAKAQTGGPVSRRTSRLFTEH